MFLNLGTSCFNNISIDYFEVRYGFDATNAGRLTTIPWVIAIFLAPLLGIAADKYGYKVTF